MPCETIVQAILDKNYTELKEDIEKVVAKKLHNRILTEKTKILAKVNGLSLDKMTEMMAVAGKK